MYTNINVFRLCIAIIIYQYTIYIESTIPMYNNIVPFFLNQTQVFVNQVDCEWKLCIIHTEMPSEILSRIPLPSLRLYSSLSILLFSGCVYYAFSVVSRDYNAKPISNLTLGNDERLLDGLEREWSVNSRRIIIKEQMRDIISFMGQDAICIWVRMSICSPIDWLHHGIHRITIVNNILYFHIQIIINMAYCCLILIGKTIQSIVFGELRISEQQVNSQINQSKSRNNLCINFSIWKTNSGTSYSTSSSLCLES